MREGKKAGARGFSVNLHPAGIAANQLMNSINDGNQTRPDYMPTIGDAAGVTTRASGYLLDPGRRLSAPFCAVAHLYS
jgi:hypothetical protein